MQFTSHPGAAKDIKAVAKISSQEASLAADVVARSSRMRRRTEIQRFHRCICLYYVLSSKEIRMNACVQEQRCQHYVDFLFANITYFW